MSKTVVVGMSGGVDSSVAALLLKQQGYRVIGLFMKNWEEETEQGSCSAQQDYEDVAKVCAQIDIPYYAVNFTKEYWEGVFHQFLEELKRGATPNPDILCNREIKFKALLEKALALGAEFLATGHYCQTRGGKLLKGADPLKDQSYFLYAIKGRVLQTVLFPVGGLPKREVRRLAQEHSLSTAHKKDSTGICFIGKRDFKSFVSQYLAYQPGIIETLEGKEVGRHDGVAYHTIGQRHGLKIGGPGEAWFVVDKDVQRNVVVVAQGAEHPALYRSRLLATDLSWISENPPPLLRCRAKIRYRQPEQTCTIEEISDGKCAVVFDMPQRAITPGQSIVFYNEEECLGGGIITH